VEVACEGGGVDSSPTIVDGLLYFTSGDRHVYAVDVDSGAQRWSVDGGDALGSSPAVVDGKVFVGAGGGRLVALDGATGGLAWSLDTFDPAAASPLRASRLPDEYSTHHPRW
jgi:outer membrane protein assembly factor BamB